MKASEISGRNPQLLTSPDDLQWAVDTLNVPPGATGVIYTGNSDWPDAVYFTRDAEPNHMDAEYTQVTS